MTLLTAIFAAEICTVLWYRSVSAREMKVGILCWMFWGASLMWLGDAIFEYAELREEYFSPSPAGMLNDLFLGLSTVALALAIWVVFLLVKDPKGVVRAHLVKKNTAEK